MIKYFENDKKRLENSWQAWLGEKMKNISKKMLGFMEGTHKTIHSFEDSISLQF
jgi:hypothetical protein